MMNVFVIFFGCVISVYAIDPKRSYDYLDYPKIGSLVTNCSSELGLEEWILTNRDSNYGWGEETHRAVIALIVSDAWSNLNDSDLVLSQLEVELSKALLRNITRLLPIGDLSLYVHAFLAAGLDPRNVHGVDLVATLQHRFLHESPVHPLPVLALCNARVLEDDHLKRIRNFLTHSSDTNLELEAIALKAFACALDEWPERFEFYRSQVSDLINVFAELQEKDGRFGNVYTTGLVVQALVASNATGWDRDLAMKYLTTPRVKNIISVYYTIMAVYSEDVQFIKSLTPAPEPRSKDGIPSLKELKSRPRKYTMQYSILSDRSPKVNFTASVLMPFNCTLFDIMRLVAAEDSNFRFNQSTSNRDPPVSLSGIPNDAEKGYYWLLLSKGQVRSRELFHHHLEGPGLVYPLDASRFFYKYVNVIDRKIQL